MRNETCSANKIFDSNSDIRASKGLSTNKPCILFFKVQSKFALIDFHLVFQVMIIGPPDTLFEGGFFKCHLYFPTEYPLRPPVLK